MFIVFEGIDFTGKTTQVNLLSNYLSKNNLKHITTREPGGTILGENIRDIIFNEEYKPSIEANLCLFLASRAEHITKIILPAIQNNDIVICDRFLLSTLVYQKAIGYDKIMSIHENIFNKFYPDLTIIFDAEPNDIVIRKQEDMLRLGNYYDNIEIDKITKNRDLFLSLSKIVPFKCEVVNTTNNSIENVFEQIINICKLYNCFK